MVLSGRAAEASGKAISKEKADRMRKKIQTVRVTLLVHLENERFVGESYDVNVQDLARGERDHHQPQGRLSWAQVVEV